MTPEERERLFGELGYGNQLETISQMQAECERKIQILVDLAERAGSLIEDLAERVWWLEKHNGWVD